MKHPNPPCHPERPYFSKNLCSRCWYKKYRNTTLKLKQEKIRAYQKKYRAENLENRKAYCVKNQEKLQKYRKIYNHNYRVENREELKAQKIEYLNKTKEIRKAKRLADCFNLSLADWDTIFTFQERKCAICKKPMNRPNVDHCHESGKIRGILCPLCNRALGRFRDSLNRLRSAVAYLENPPATQALGEERFGYPGRINTKKHRKWLKEQKALDKILQS